MQVFLYFLPKCMGAFGFFAQMPAPDHMSASERLLERYGFPIFVALCSMTLFVAVWRYFSKELSVTRKEFTEYLSKRDVQVDKMIETFNESFNKNTVAIIELKHAVTKRIHLEETQARTLSSIDKKL